MLSAAKSEKPAKEETIQLPKMTVKGEAVCSFGIGIVGSRDSQTRKIKRLFVSSVGIGSTADKLGLKRGDEILSINGVKVAGLDGEMKHGSWLFDLLVDQEPGTMIDLEMEIRTVKAVTLRASSTSDYNGSMFAPSR